MSSGSSGRYQSRIFNFVNQQSRRLTQKLDNTLRYLQVATKWGVEALLYPVYLFLYSDDSSVKKLDTKEPQGKPTLQPHDSDLSTPSHSTADTSIQRVLEIVQNLPSAETSVTTSKKSRIFQTWEFLKAKFFHRSPNNSNLSQSLTVPDTTVVPPSTLKHHLPIVRGIATDLSDRQLVLVSIENQILDILSSQQQAKLAARIKQEVGDDQPSQLIPEIARILTKLTGNNTNQTPLLTPPQKIWQPNKIVTFIDNTFAKLEAKTILPVQQRSQEIVRVAQTQLHIFIYGKEQAGVRGEITVKPDGLETQNLNIAALIEAAVNYFFGVGRDKQLESSFFEQPLLNSHFSDDPWLEWHDLYINSDNIPTKTTPPSPKINPRIASTTSTWPSSQRKLTAPKPKTPSSSPQKKQPNRHLTQIHTTFSKIISPKQIETYLSQQQVNQETQVEAKPDWIETTATSLGYEKHPLEKVLEWLDRGMLWLEEILGEIFQWWQSLWRGK
ncbi:hypothetical protein [Nostoc sp. TCL26-01]|uniref:hypothetical protein n=1 Tax=Nostoc sp. TCL26-01 TaxID=2576904 RepID=UPI0015BD651D|nr:hypothetical protein [Nostoc sp. TCL26-01]QLE59102.1 hypothetical protein FD725_28570 [Nostoc sp. TCL26-01]